MKDIKIKTLQSTITEKLQALFKDEVQFTIDDHDQKTYLITFTADGWHTTASVAKDHYDSHWKQHLSQLILRYIEYTLSK